MYVTFLLNKLSVKHRPVRRFFAALTFLGYMSMLGVYFRCEDVPWGRYVRRNFSVRWRSLGYIRRYFSLHGRSVGTLGVIIRCIDDPWIQWTLVFFAMTFRRYVRRYFSLPQTFRKYRQHYNTWTWYSTRFIIFFCLHTHWCKHKYVHFLYSWLNL